MNETHLLPCGTVCVRYHNTIKLLEENIDKTVSDINCSDIFFCSSPKVVESKN